VFALQDELAATLAAEACAVIDENGGAITDHVDARGWPGRAV
jgi:hypothetical protein